MSYESDDYRTLKGQIRRLEIIKEQIDLARDFERMKYSGKMRIVTAPKTTPFESGEEISVEISDYLKPMLIKVAVEWAIDGALNAADRIEAKPFDIHKCVAI